MVIYLLRVALSTTPTDNAVDEELVTSSDGQSYDSETLIHSSVDHTPQVSTEFLSELYQFVRNVFYYILERLYHEGVPKSKSGCGWSADGCGTPSRVADANHKSATTTASCETAVTGGVVQ